MSNMIMSKTAIGPLSGLVARMMDESNEKKTDT